MTREEAKRYFEEYQTDDYDNAYGKREIIKMSEYKEIIDKIYDDFESKVCKNCKWFDGRMYCLNEENDTYNEILDFRLLRKVSKNSTCEKFEKK